MLVSVNMFGHKIEEAKDKGCGSRCGTAHNTPLDLACDTLVLWKMTHILVYDMGNIHDS